VKKYIIDTNALISYVTDRHPDQQKKMAGIFQEVVKLKAVILCSPNVLTEFIYVLDKVYGVPKTDIQRMVKDFLALPGIQLVHEIDFESVLKFWPESLPDFGDAIVASLRTLYKGSVIVTFDLKFIHALRKFGLPVEKP
jgi:predicted nucleic-acid-binding protein